MKVDMDFLEKLWALDDAAKTRILVGATLVAMVIVMFAWYLYFNSIIVGASGGGAAVIDQSAGAGATAASGAEPAGNIAVQPAAPDVLQNIAGFFAGMARGLGNIFRAPRQYDIQPSR